MFLSKAYLINKHYWVISLLLFNWQVHTTKHGMSWVLDIVNLQSALLYSFYLVLRPISQWAQVHYCPCFELPSWACYLLSESQCKWHNRSVGINYSLTILLLAWLSPYFYFKGRFASFRWLYGRNFWLLFKSGKDS